MWLERTCPEHGEVSCWLVWSGPPNYDDRLRAAGSGPSCCDPAENPDCPTACGLCASHVRQTCCVLLEVTARCDLGVPRSVLPVRGGAARRGTPRSTRSRGWFRRVLERGSRAQRAALRRRADDARRPAAGHRSRPLSRGSPSCNSTPTGCGSRPKTMGTRKRLAAAGLQTGLPAVRRRRRRCLISPFAGAPWPRSRTRARVERCAEAGLGVVLVPTVARGVNLDQPWADPLLCPRAPARRARHPSPAAGAAGQIPGRRSPPPVARVTLPDVMRELAAQSGGRLSLEDFRSGRLRACPLLVQQRVPAGAPTGPSLARQRDARDAGVELWLRASPGATRASAAAGEPKNRQGGARGASAGPRPVKSCCSCRVMNPKISGTAILSPDPRGTRSASAPWRSRTPGPSTWSAFGTATCTCSRPTGASSPFCAYNLTAADGQGTGERACRGSAAAAACRHRPGTVGSASAGRGAVSDAAASAPRRTPLEPWVLRRAGGARPGGPAPPPGARTAGHRRCAPARAAPSTRERCAAFDAADAPSCLERRGAAAVHHGRRHPRAGHAHALRAGRARSSASSPCRRRAPQARPKRIAVHAPPTRQLTVDFFRYGHVGARRAAATACSILLPGARPGSVGRPAAPAASTRLGADAAACTGRCADVAEAARPSCGSASCASVVVGIPVQVLGLARLSVAEGGASAPCKTVLLSTDHVPRAVLSAAIERRLGTAVSSTTTAPPRWVSAAAWTAPRTPG